MKLYCIVFYTKKIKLDGMLKLVKNKKKYFEVKLSELYMGVLTCRANAWAQQFHSRLVHLIELYMKAWPCEVIHKCIGNTRIVATDGI